jgi:hypothetical protein
MRAAHTAYQRAYRKRPEVKERNRVRSSAWYYAHHEEELAKRAARRECGL